MVNMEMILVNVAMIMLLMTLNMEDDGNDDGE